MLLELIDALAQQAAAAVKAQFPDGAEHVGERLPVERSNKADLQTAAALQLNKKLKVKPQEIAAAIATALGAHPAIARAEVAGPGFVNLTLADAWLAEHATDALALPRRGQGQRVVI